MTAAAPPGAPVPAGKTLGQVCYEEFRGDDVFGEGPVPWEKLPARVQARWALAAEAVRVAAGGAPAPS